MQPEHWHLCGEARCRASHKLGPAGTSLSPQANFSATPREIASDTDAMALACAAPACDGWCEKHESARLAAKARRGREEGVGIGRQRKKRGKRLERGAESSREITRQKEVEAERESALNPKPEDGGELGSDEARRVSCPRSRASLKRCSSSMPRWR